jgi:hypothetical protein
MYMKNTAWKKATEMMERLLHIKKGALPPDHPDVLKLQSDLDLLLNKFPTGEYPMSDATPSIYRPLNHEARSIRLVSIKKGTQESALHANLFYVSLNNAPGAFLCVGRYVQSWTIDAKWEITNNLQGALLQLRSETDNRLLWVDTICINQEDTKERSHQVQLMRVIYTTARRTLVWLGRATAASDLAMEFLAELEAHLSPDDVALRTMKDLRETLCFAAYATRSKSDRIGIACGSFRKLFARRPWYFTAADTRDLRYGGKPLEDPSYDTRKAGKSP